MVTFWDRPLAENAYIVPNDTLLQQLQRALSGRNIAAITGPYGVGKTFLARQYAERYQSQYPGGIRYCGTPLEFQHAVESLPAAQVWITADCGRRTDQSLLRPQRRS